MPLVAITTPANGDERQLLPMLAQIRLATGKRGNPKRRPKTLAADKGYDARWLRKRLRTKGIRPQIKKRLCRGKKPKGRPIKDIVPPYQQERSFSWFQRKYRRLVIRWERLKVCFDAFLLLACSYIWFPRVSGIGSSGSIIFTIIRTKEGGVKNSPPSCAPLIANLFRKYS